LKYIAVLLFTLIKFRTSYFRELFTILKGDRADKIG